MRRYLLSLLILFLVATTLAHANSKVIRFATEPTYPPFEYVDDAGEIQGFDIEIAKALCHEIQAQCTFANQSFNSLLPSLEMGKFDAIIATLGVTPERQKQVNFSDAYYEPSASFVAPLAKTVFDPKTQVVGTQQGSTFERYLYSTFGKIVHVKSYASAQDALLDLMAGRVDVVLTDTPIAQNWLIQAGNNKRFGILGKPIVDSEFFGSGYGIAVDKKNSMLLKELNAALKKIKQNGTYHQIVLNSFNVIASQGFVKQTILATEMTLKLAFTSLVFGLLIGLMGAFLESIPNRGFRYIAASIIFLVRALPELLVLFFIYFGLAKVLSFIFNRYVDISPFMAGVVALSLIFGAYASQVFQSAFLAIDRGQLEAGKAMGLSSLQVNARIQLPQAWRHALPGLGNLWLILLKDTAIVSLIGLNDLMNAAKTAASTMQQPFTFYLLAAGIYLLITTISQFLLDYLANRSNRYLHV